MFYILQNTSQELELSHDVKHNHSFEPLFFVGQIIGQCHVLYGQHGSGLSSACPQKEPLIRLLLCLVTQLVSVMAVPDL